MFCGHPILSIPLFITLSTLQPLPIQLWDCNFFFLLLSSLNCICVTPIVLGLELWSIVSLPTDTLKQTNKQKLDSPSPTSHQMLTASLLVVRWHISLPNSMLLSGWSFRLPWALWVLSKFLGVCVSGKHFSSKSFIVSSCWTLFFKWLVFEVSYECLFQDCTLYNL